MLRDGGGRGFRVRRAGAMLSFTLASLVDGTLEGTPPFHIVDPTTRLPTKEGNAGDAGRVRWSVGASREGHRAPRFETGQRPGYRRWARETCGHGPRQASEPSPRVPVSRRTSRRRPEAAVAREPRVGRRPSDCEGTVDSPAADTFSLAACCTTASAAAGIPSASATSATRTSLRAQNPT